MFVGIRTSLSFETAVIAPAFTLGVFERARMGVCFSQLEHSTHRCSRRCGLSAPHSAGDSCRPDLSQWLQRYHPGGLMDAARPCRGAAIGPAPPSSDPAQAIRAGSRCHNGNVYSERTSPRDVSSSTDKGKKCSTELTPALQDRHSCTSTIFVVCHVAAASHP
jgi:hypothetical protein